MGKKKIVPIAKQSGILDKIGTKKENNETVLAEKTKVESAIASAKGGSASGGKSFVKKVDTGNAYVKATYNNTLISITDEKGNLLAWSSAGSLGFSGPKKATPFAASKIVLALTEKLKKTGPVNLHVIVTGVGGGRDSAVRSFANQGFNILSIRDVTPIPHNGPRPTKVRRV